jgi:carboxymethylenebutenolidase
MATTRTESIPLEGGEMSAHLSIPDPGTGPGILLIHEIGGVNGYIKEVADRLAGLGYVAMAPDVLWRVQPEFSVETFNQETLGQAMGVVGQLDGEQALADLGAALEHLRELPEVVGGVGVLGFCFGGTYAYLVAAEYEPDVAVSYYGSGVAGSIDRAEEIECPTLFHFGGQDPYLPADQVQTIRDAVVGMPHVEILVQPEGGHAFDNHASEMFHQPEAAAAAWTRTAAFLNEHLPSG